MKKNFRVIILFASLTVIFCYKVISFDYMLSGSDYILQGQYFTGAVQESIRNSQMPFWLPNIQSGMPNISAVNTAFFYPSFLVANLLRVPPHIIYNFDFMLHVFLAGLFMFLLQNYIY